MFAYSIVFTAVQVFYRCATAAVNTDIAQTDSSAETKRKRNRQPVTNTEQ